MVEVGETRSVVDTPVRPVVGDPTFVEAVQDAEELVSSWTLWGNVPALAQVMVSITDWPWSIVIEEEMVTELPVN